MSLKNLLVGPLLLVLFGCGAPVTKETVGYVEATQLVVWAKQLTGLSVSVNGETVVSNIERSDLNKFKYGVLGTKNSEKEDMQSITLGVNKGSNLITITDNEKPIYQKSLYFTNGQTREIRIDQ